MHADFKVLHIWLICFYTIPKRFWSKNLHNLLPYFTFPWSHLIQHFFANRDMLSRSHKCFQLVLRYAIRLEIIVWHRCSSAALSVCKYSLSFFSFSFAHYEVHIYGRKIISETRFRNQIFFGESTNASIKHNFLFCFPIESWNLS